MRVSSVSVLLVAGLAGAAGADVVKSTFDAGDEGWMVSDAATPANESVSGEPVYRGSGGNEGGFIFAPFNWGTRSFLVAPAAFRGDRSSAFGTELSFDRMFVEPRTSVDPWIVEYAEDVLLTSGSMTIYADLDAIDPDADWETIAIELSEAGGWRHLDSGNFATDAEIAGILGDLDDLRVRAHINPIASHLGFDNFSLVPAPGGLMLAGIGVLAASRRRR